jgi:hypothetical protein
VPPIVINGRRLIAAVFADFPCHFAKQPDDVLAQALLAVLFALAPARPGSVALRQGAAGLPE